MCGVVFTWLSAIAKQALFQTIFPYDRLRRPSMNSRIAHMRLYTIYNLLWKARKFTYLIYECRLFNLLLLFRGRWRRNMTTRRPTRFVAKNCVYLCFGFLCVCVKHCWSTCHLLLALWLLEKLETSIFYSRCTYIGEWVACDATSRGSSGDEYRARAFGVWILVCFINCFALGFHFKRVAC